MYYFRIMQAVVKLFYCGNNCTFTYLLFIYLEFGIRWGFFKKASKTAIIIVGL
jgi:hypothetical protein